MKYGKTKRNKGQAMIIGIIFLLVSSLILIVGISAPLLSELRMISAFEDSLKSLAASESAMEDAVLRVKQGEQITATSIELLEASATATVTAFSDGREINAIGDSHNKIRKQRTVVIIGDGAAFHYGIQTGNGGFVMAGNAGVYGNVYSNGSISGQNGSFVTGSAITAGTSTINNVDVGQDGSGDAHSYQVRNSTIAGQLFCKTGSGNNKPCNTSRENAVSQNFPLDQEDFDKWKLDAEAGQIINGNHSIVGNVTLGPAKIIGDLYVRNGSRLILNDTVYVTGNIIFETNAGASLSPQYEENGGILLADGYIDLSNNVVFAGSGYSSSYLLLITTSDCPVSAYCGGRSAIDVKNNVSTVILNAQYGTIHFSNNAGANAAVAHTLRLDNNATITYLSGLVDLSFDSGPSGGFEIESWQEVE